MFTLSGPSRQGEPEIFIGVCRAQRASGPMCPMELLRAAVWSVPLVGLKGCVLPAPSRFTWDVTRRAKAGRAVVLTTHSMEEADLLADDIAIMAAGRLAAHGSPLELKARHGVGYTLTLVRRVPDRCAPWFWGSGCRL